MENNLLEKLKKATEGIKKKNFAPCYFIYGDEPYFINSLIGSIKKEFVDNTGMNIKSYDNDNFDIEEAARYIDNMPLMNDKKLVIFKDVDFFRKKKKNEKEKNDEIALLTSMERAKDINVIVIANTETEYKYQDRYKGNKIVDFANKNGILIDSKKLSENELSKYVANHFKKANVDIDKVNLSYFIRNAGKNIYMLYSEADKLISYLGEKKKATKEDIDNCISRNVEDNVFGLIDLVNAGRKEEAYKIYGDLLSEGINEFVIFSCFTTNFENLLVVKDLTEQSKSLRDILDITKFPDWKVRKLQDANKGFTKELLLAKLKKITELNYDYMKGNLNQNLLTELLLV